MTVPPRLPWWLSAVLGVGLAAVGVVLVFRPFESLTVLVLVVAISMIVTGVAELAASAGRGWPARLAALAWFAAGVVLLVWPDVTTVALAWVVGLALVVGGVFDVIDGVRGTVDERAAAIVGGLASIVFGVLALSWADVTLLVVAVVFGARTFVAGVRLAWRAVHGRPATPGRPSAAPGRARRVTHLVVAVASLLVAVGLAGVSAKLEAGKPVVDAFYTPPDELPSEPGTLLCAEPFTRTIPSTANAWRILYTTTRSDGTPAVASALVVAPATTSASPSPVIALAHGTTGIARRCAPSVLDDPFGAGAFYALDEVIEEDWVLVATDYTGLGTPGPHGYLVGEEEGRAVLDSVRAARQLDGVSLSDETVVWGHSQGGGATLWTAQIAASYAPDVPLAGAAALAPASDLPGLAANFGDVTGGSIFATYLIAAYAAVYPDVRVGDYLEPAARSSFDGIASRCLSEPAVLASVVSALAPGSMFTTLTPRGAFLQHLQENSPTGPFAAPLLVAQGESDSLILPSVQSAYVESLCAGGVDVDYRTFPGLDHVPLVEADSPLIPELVAWTRDRLAGRPRTPNCSG